jgi:hypothetical protein
MNRLSILDRIQQGFGAMRPQQQPITGEFMSRFLSPLPQANAQFPPELQPQPQQQQPMQNAAPGMAPEEVAASQTRAPSFLDRLGTTIDRNSGMLMAAGGGLLREGWSGMGDATQGIQMDQQRQAAQAEQEEEQRRRDAMTREAQRLGITQDQIDAGLGPQLLQQRISQSTAGQRRILTPEEAAERGLPAIPGITYQEAPNGTITEVGEREQPSIYDEEFLKNRARAMSEMATQFETRAQTSRDALRTLNGVEALLDDENVYTGFGSEFVRMARQLGIGNADGIDSTEAFKSATQELALDVMGGSLGAGFSNADRDFVQGQVPNMAFTREGNRLRIEMLRRAHQRNLEIEELMRRHMSDNGGILTADFQRELNELEQVDIFDDEFRAMVMANNDGPDESQQQVQAPEGFQPFVDGLDPEYRERFLTLPTEQQIQIFQAGQA